MENKFISFEDSVYGGVVAKENILSMTLEGTMYDYEKPTIVVTTKHGEVLAEMKFQYYSKKACIREFERIKKELMGQE